MLLGHEILHRRWQKQRLVDLPGAKSLAHAHNRIRLALPWPEQSAYYSDGLLAKRQREVSVRAQHKYLHPRPRASVPIEAERGSPREPGSTSLANASEQLRMNLAFLRKSFRARQAS
jgi:hypothetical protein